MNTNLCSGTKEVYLHYSDSCRRNWIIMPKSLHSRFIKNYGQLSYCSDHGGPFLGKGSFYPASLSRDMF